MKTDIKDIHYEMSILSGGLIGLGLSMSVHNGLGESDQITELHAAQLGHLVEACGRYAERLAADLDLALDQQRKASGEYLHLKAGGGGQ
jgi:hypothetical protein